MTAADAEAHRVICHLADLLKARSLTLVELAAMTGVTVANLSVLKNDRARATRFTTLTAICDALSCQPGDLLEIQPRTATQVLHDGVDTGHDRLVQGSYSPRKGELLSGRPSAGQSVDAARPAACADVALWHSLGWFG